MHRGGTLNGMLVTVSIVGALTAATVFVAPRYLAARPVAGLAAVPASRPRHQTLIDDLASLIAQSVGVLAIHGRGATPYEEIVLWLADGDPDGTDGRADIPELAILSHSTVMQTITIYRLPQGSAAFSATRPASPEFCSLWRADPGVDARVLGLGVSDMRVETIGDGQDQWGESGQWGALQRLRLTLTWAADSADGADEASVVVDTVLFPDGVGP